MKIKLNGIVKDYTTKEVAQLHRQGYRFRYSAKQDAYVPESIQIHERGQLRNTDLEELISRRAGGTRFLKVKHQQVYAPVDADKYYTIMRPIWREDKREKRSQHCIYEGKSCCANRDCASCRQPVYQTEYIDDVNLPVSEDIANLEILKERNQKLYEVIDTLEPDDLKILLLNASGKSEREIAAVMGFASKTSVAKRLKKVRSRLQKELEDFL